MIRKNKIQKAVRRAVASSGTILHPGDGTTNWFSLSQVTASLRKVLPNSTTMAWGKVARFGVVPAGKDFTLTFGLEYMAGQSSNGFVMIGITNPLNNIGYLNLEYGLYLNAGNSITIWENGGAPSGQQGIGGGFVVSDNFSIKRVSSTISYYKGASLLYDSLIPSSADFDVSVDINRFLGLKDIELTIH